MLNAMSTKLTAFVRLAILIILGSAAVLAGPARQVQPPRDPSLGIALERVAYSAAEASACARSRPADIRTSGKSPRRISR